MVVWFGYFVSENWDAGFRDVLRAWSKDLVFNLAHVLGLGFGWLGLNVPRASFIGGDWGFGFRASASCDPKP